MKTLHKGLDPNSLEILVNNIEINPFSQMKSGIIESAIIIKISQYHLEDLLIQLLDDYGYEYLINKIRSLEN